MNNMLLEMYKTNSTPDEDPGHSDRGSHEAGDSTVQSNLPERLQDTPPLSDGTTPPAGDIPHPPPGLQVAAAGHAATTRGDLETYVVLDEAESSKLSWQSITKTPPTTPTSLQSPLKKAVTFSTPEVTKQHHFEVPEEEEEGEGGVDRGKRGQRTKAKKPKKRHREALEERARVKKGRWSKDSSKETTQKQKTSTSKIPLVFIPQNSLCFPMSP